MSILSILANAREFPIDAVNALVAAFTQYTTDTSSSYSAAPITQTKNGNFNATTAPLQYYRVDTSGGLVSCNLPTAASAPNAQITIMATSDAGGGGGPAAFAPNGADTINGVNAGVSTAAAQDTITVRSDGVSNWSILAYHAGGSLP